MSAQAGGFFSKRAKGDLEKRGKIKKFNSFVYKEIGDFL